MILLSAVLMFASLTVLIVGLRCHRVLRRKRARKLVAKLFPATPHTHDREVQNLLRRKRRPR